MLTNQSSTDLRDFLQEIFEAYNYRFDRIVLNKNDKGKIFVRGEFGTIDGNEKLHLSFFDWVWPALATVLGDTDTAHLRSIGVQLPAHVQDVTLTSQSNNDNIQIAADIIYKNNAPH